MTTSFKHGITINELTTGARAITDASTSIIGLLATGEDADDDMFPLNKPVLLDNPRAAIGKAGTTGTLAKALSAILEQCTPTIVVVRVTEGANEAATSTNMIGTTTEAGQLTGMQALLVAESQLGVRPTILGAPGHDTATVTAAFAAVARKLRGFLYAAAVGDDTADVITYRGTFSQRELMLIWPEFTDFTGSAVARAMGTRAYLDATEGWHKSLSNTGVMGVTGLTKDVFFDILSTDTMAGVLNDGGLTTLIRQTGFRFWGNRTCSDDPKFAFECVVRSSNFLKDTIAQGLLWAIDKPLTAQLIKDIVESINAELRKLVRQGRLIGASCWFDPAANSATDLAGGKLVLDYDFTAVAPNEAMGLNQRITDKYYANIAQQLQALG